MTAIDIHGSSWRRASAASVLSPQSARLECEPSLRHQGFEPEGGPMPTIDALVARGRSLTPSEVMAMVME